MPKKFPYPAVFLLLLAALAFTQERDRRFIGHHDWDNVGWLSAAEYWQRHGLLDLRLQQFTTPYPADPDTLTSNQHHPPGISLITLLGLTLFGGFEFSARLMPIFASLLTVALFYRLVKKTHAVRVARLATFFLILTPLMVYYSAKIGHEQFLLPLMLIFALAYRRWWQEGRNRHLLSLLPVIVAGGFIGWAWYLFLGLVGLYTVGRRRDGRSLTALWPIIAAAGFSLAGFLALGLWQNPDFLTTLREAFFNRTGGGEAGRVGLGTWLLVVGATYFWLPTPIVTLLAALMPALRPIQGEAGQQAGLPMLGLMALTGLIYTLVFWQATYIHDYLIYYLIPPLCAWAAIGYHRLLYRYRPPTYLWRQTLRVLLLLFVLGSVRWSVSLYTEDTGEQRYEWGVIAGAATAPGESVAVNVEDFGPHVSYYARRRVDFDIRLEEVFTRDYGFYIYCVEKGDTLPDTLTLYRATYDDKALCYLLDLRP